ncbi:MAG: ATP-binding protein [Acidobacteria bacterium]|nr:ATP-binding protein [Acidobacteriota bacterium]
MSELTSIKSESCSICQGTGWDVAAAGGARRCHCALDSRGVRLLEKAGVPKRYESCDLNNYDGRHCESQGKAKMVATKFVEDFPVIDVGLLFLGPCGVGKTHLAVGIIKVLMLEKGIPCLFYDFRELIREIQNSYNPTAQTSEMKILTPVLESPVLVLDELVAAKPTHWVTDTITYVINRRYNDKRITIFTSNFLDNPAERGDETLTDRVGIRLRSRLYEMCHDVIISADDFRKKVRWKSAKFALE